MTKPEPVIAPIQRGVPIPETARPGSIYQLEKLAVGESYELPSAREATNVRVRVHKLKAKGLRFTVRKIPDTKDTYGVWRLEDAPKAAE